MSRPIEIGVHVAVLVQDHGHRLAVTIQGQNRGGVVLELTPVVGRGHEPDQRLLPVQHARRKAGIPEHRVIGEEGEGLHHAAALRLERDILPVHAPVHGGRARTPRGLVDEDREGIALVRVQRAAVHRARHAAARAVGEIAFRDIVRVEVDHPGMVRRQQEARPVLPQQGAARRDRRAWRRADASRSSPRSPAPGRNWSAPCRSRRGPPTGASSSAMIRSVTTS